MKKMNRVFFRVGLAAILSFVAVGFAIDTDNDGMSDLYENFFRLNPTNSLDAAGNYDSDTLDNLSESLLWTDPLVGDTDADGFPDDEDANPLSRAVIFWGYSKFTTGDDYKYTGPDWWTGAHKEGGSWGTNHSWVVSAGEAGSLFIDLDRNLLSSDLMLDLIFTDTTNTTVRLDLLASDSSVVTNLQADITAGSGQQVFRRYVLPLASCIDAVQVRLSAEQVAEPFSVYSSVLYVDEDGDGLDADQEAQMGTLDTNPDCDGDGLSDYQEHAYAFD